MQFNYIDALGQHQVGMLDQIPNMISMGQLTQQSQFFDQQRGQWLFLGQSYPQLFQSQASNYQHPHAEQHVGHSLTPAIQSSQVQQQPTSQAFQLNSATTPAGNTISPQDQANALLRKSIMENHYPSWLLFTLIGVSLLSLSVGQYGVSYWLTLLSGITGIIIFSLIRLTTGLQIMVTTLLCVLIWIVPFVNMVGTHSNKNVDSSAQIKNDKKP